MRCRFIFERLSVVQVSALSPSRAAERAIKNNINNKQRSKTAEQRQLTTSKQPADNRQIAIIRTTKATISYTLRDADAFFTPQMLFRDAVCSIRVVAAAVVFDVVVARIGGRFLSGTFVSPSAAFRDGGGARQEAATTTTKCSSGIPRS